MLKWKWNKGTASALEHLIQNIPVEPVPSLPSTLYLLTTCGDVCGLELRDFIARPANTASSDSPGCLWRPVQLIDAVSVRSVSSRTKKLPWKNKGT